MKNRKLRMLSALAGSLLFAAAPVQAQFQYAANPDNIMQGPGSNFVYQTINTGNDAGNYAGTEFKVMTWDGARPSIGWDYGNGSIVGSDYIVGFVTGPTYPVSDPDIVMDTDGNGFAAVTYERDMGSGTEIWAETWRFNGSTMVLVAGPFRIDDPTLGISRNPNIDIDINNPYAVITYEQNGTIYAHGYDIYGGGPAGNIFRVSSCLANTNAQPDVACYYDPVSTETIVSFTFTYMDNNTVEVLVLNQQRLTDILTQPAAPCNNYFIDRVMASLGGFLERPRIAAPDQFVSSDRYDIYIVVHKDDTFNGDEIMGYSKNAAAHGLGNIFRTQVNDQYGLTGCNNSEPAVTFVRNNIIVAWTYNDSNCGNINGDSEILVRQLDDAGNALYIDYSVVNMNLNDWQFAPSVAGRYDLNNETLYTFYDQGMPYILYKSSFYGNQNLRKGNAAAAKTGLTVYPMPVTGKSTLAYSIPEGETGVALELYSLTGQKVRSYNVSGKAEGSYAADFSKNAQGSDLPAGMYMLRLSTSKSTQATRVVIGN